jgi:hypothetical protein
MFYIGCHQTDNLQDGYLGSGKHLIRAIKKYGKENFTYEVLYEFDCKEKMFEMEQAIVNESFVKNPLTYNLKIGGSGGNPGIIGAFKGRTHTEETKEKIRQAACRQKVSDDTKEKLSKNAWARRDPTAQKKHASRINLGVPKSAEHKLKLSAAQKNKRLVNNGLISTWITLQDLDMYLSQGWCLGRKK